jgi:MFS family permease
MGDGVSLTALTLLLLPHGSGAVAVVLVAGSLPRLLGPLSGVLADRTSLRRLMLGASLLGAVCLLVLALVPLPLPGVTALVAVSALGATAFGPAYRRAVPELVPAERLPAANGLNALANQLALTLGAAAGGAVVAATSPRQALLVDAVSFLLAATVLRGLPALDRHRATAPGSVGRDLREGLVVAVTTPVLRSLLLTVLLIIAFAGIDNVALVFLVRDDLGASDTAYGLVSAVFGLALCATTVVAARTRAEPGRLLLVSIGVSAAGPLVLSQAPGLAVACLGAALTGAGNGLDVLAADGLLQRATGRHLLGRVGGAYQACAQLGMVLSYALGGPLVAGLGARGAFVVGGVGTLLALTVIGPVVRTRLPAAA